MATGSIVAFFATGFTADQVNVVLTADGSTQLGTGVPLVSALIDGDYNIEMATAFLPAPFNLAPGYQASASVPSAVSITNNLIQGGDPALGPEELLTGTGYSVIDRSGGEYISIDEGGSGASTVTMIGSAGDTLIGSQNSNASQLIDLSGVNPEVVPPAESVAPVASGATVRGTGAGGGAGNTTVWASDGVDVSGGAGNITVAGNGGSGLSITGGTGNLTAFNIGANSRVTGSGGGGTTFIDDTYGTGGGSTLTGGTGTGVFDASVFGFAVNTYIKAAPGDSVEGAPANIRLGPGASTLVDATAGSIEVIGALSAPSTVFGGAGDSIQARGDLTVAGNGQTNETVIGSFLGGNLTAFNFGTGNQVSGASVNTGTTFIDDGYAGGGDNTITGGAGHTTIIGGKGDTINGGSDSTTGAVVLTLIDTTLGQQTVSGGNGATTVEGGASVSVTGGSGAVTFAGDAAAGDTVVGGKGSLTAFNLGAKASVTGSTSTTSFIDDSYGNGGSGTLTAGSGGGSTIISGAGDSVVGSSAAVGTLEARFGSNLTTENVNLSTVAGRGAAGLRDVSVTGGNGTSVTVVGFNTATDVIESATASPAGTFLGTSKSDGSGGTTLTFLDGSTMDIKGVASAASITFTS